MEYIWFNIEYYWFKTVTPKGDVIEGIMCAQQRRIQRTKYGRALFLRGPMVVYNPRAERKYQFNSEWAIEPDLITGDATVEEYVDWVIKANEEKK